MTKLLLLPDPIAPLWQGARALLTETLRAFGSPAAVARAMCAAFKRRLALLESLVMKLLLIEASRLRSDVPPASSRHDCGSAGTAVACRTESAGWKPAVHASEDPAHPETWRVRFHTRMPRSVALAHSMRRPSPGAAAPSNPESRARRLARRFEALRRVLADPRRAIAALARKLAALGQRAYAAARAIALNTPRGADGMLHAHALVHACDGGKVFRDSS